MANEVNRCPKWATVVMQDGKGKTEVHELIWKYLRKHGEYNCSCPVKLAVGSVKCLMR